MATKDLVTPTIGVLNVDGLHRPDGSLVTHRRVIRHGSDVSHGAWRHGPRIGRKEGI